MNGEYLIEVVPVGGRYTQIEYTAELQNNPGESNNAPHYCCLSPLPVTGGASPPSGHQIFGFRMCHERAEVYCNDSGIVVDVVTVPLVAVTATL